MAIVWGFSFPHTEKFCFSVSVKVCSHIRRYSFLLVYRVGLTQYVLIKMFHLVLDVLIISLRCFMVLSLYLFYLNFYLLLEPTFNLKKCLLLLPVYSKKTQKDDVAEGDTLLFLDVMLMQDQNSAVASAPSALTLCSARLLSGCLCSLQGLCDALVFQRDSSGCLDSEHVCREKLLRKCP